MLISSMLSIVPTLFAILLNIHSSLSKACIIMLRTLVDCHHNPRNLGLFLNIFKAWKNKCQTLSVHIFLYLFYKYLYSITVSYIGIIRHIILWAYVSPPPPPPGNGKKGGWVDKKFVIKCLLDDFSLNLSYFLIFFLVENWPIFGMQTVNNFAVPRLPCSGYFKFFCMQFSFILHIFNFGYSFYHVK